MKIYLLLSLLFLTIKSFAIPTTMQSTPDTRWNQLETQNFKIIYPDYLKKKAEHTLALLEFYRPIISKTYNITPKKLTVILRAQNTEPNGLVTLAPKRSEWNVSENTTPLLGTLDWYQTLAIHEYRHSIQFDHLSRGAVRVGYYLFGENILGILLNIVATNWYFEGDAVYAETIYSDGGRGRSPRFSSRFKALIMSNQVPTFDELLADDYEKNLVNRYVYGYYLIAKGVKDYGDDFWYKVSSYASDRPYNLFAFYTSFELFTGKTIDQFYDELIKELQGQWTAPPSQFLKTKSKKFQNTYYPVKNNHNLYYFKEYLNKNLALYINHKKVSELNADIALSSYTVKNDKILFTQFLPDERYSFNNYSDLYEYDIKSLKLSRLSYKKRYFHPRYHASSNQLLMIEKASSDQYQILVNNRPYSITPYIPMQVDWIDAQNIAGLAIDQKGQRLLFTYNLTQQKIDIKLAPSRNNIFNIRVQDDLLFFEAEFQGTIQIFNYNLTENSLKKCSNEYIAAYMPWIDTQNQTIDYVWESANGKMLTQKPLICDPLTSDTLLKQELFLSQGPSDNYHKSAPVKVDITQIPKMISKDQVYHDELDGLFRPHSWSFIGGRGFQIGVTSQNYTGTMGLSSAIGVISGEGTGFIQAQFDYMKYYPIISLNTDFANRSLKINNETSKWSESELGVNIILPYLKIANFYSTQLKLGLGNSLINVTKNDYQSVYKLNNERLVTSSIFLNFSYSKVLTKQQIQSKWSFRSNLSYTDINSVDRSETNYLTQYKFAINLPSYFENHGFNLDFSGEIRPKSEDLFKLQGNYIPIINNKFSRGYQFEFTPEFHKISVNYVMPLCYPRYTLADWLYINRLYARLFTDYTKLETTFDQSRTLGSNGIEFIIDTNTVRKFPLSYGLRILNKQDTGNLVAEFYLATLLM